MSSQSSRDMLNNYLRAVLHPSEGAEKRAQDARKQIIHSISNMSTAQLRDFLGSYDGLGAIIVDRVGPDTPLSVQRDIVTSWMKAASNNIMKDIGGDPRAPYNPNFKSLVQGIRDEYNTTPDNAPYISAVPPRTPSLQHIDANTQPRANSEYRDAKFVRELIAASALERSQRSQSTNSSSSPNGVTPIETSRSKADVQDSQRRYEEAVRTERSLRERAEARARESEEAAVSSNLKLDNIRKLLEQERLSNKDLRMQLEQSRRATIDVEEQKQSVISELWVCNRRADEMEQRLRQAHEDVSFAVEDAKAKTETVRRLENELETAKQTSGGSAARYGAAPIHLYGDAADLERMRGTLKIQDITIKRHASDKMMLEAEVKALKDRLSQARAELVECARSGCLAGESNRSAASRSNISGEIAEKTISSHREEITMLAKLVEDLRAKIADLEKGVVIPADHPLLLQNRKLRKQLELMRADVDKARQSVEAAAAACRENKQTN